MEIPAPVLAFLAALPEGADNCSVSFGGVVVSISRPNMLVYTGFEPVEKIAERVGLGRESSFIRDDQGRVPVPAHARRVDDLAMQGKALGLTADELARAAARRPTDVASLSQQMPAFEDDPLAPETEVDRLTDKARAEFAAATAPPKEET